MRNTVAIFMAALAVVSCSKSSGGGSSLVGSTSIDAQFIDDPVKGLEFESSLGNGKTASQGKFKCKKGEAVKFKIAGLELGEAVCGEKIFVDDLVSQKPGFSPDKVAAIIQSFSVPGTDELDLTPALALIPNNHLATMFDAASTSAAFESSLEAKVDIPELEDIEVEFVDLTVARNTLNQNLEDFTNIPAPIKAAMDESLGEDIKVTGKLTSKDPNDYCYDFVQGRINVSKKGNIYYLNVTKFASFDALDVYNPLTNLCEEAGWCDDHDDVTNYVTLPDPKPITSDKVNYLVLNKVVDPENNEIVYETSTAAQLQASVSGGDVVLSGSLSETGVVVTDEGDTVNISCSYSLTSNDVSIPKEGPFTEYGDNDNDDDEAEFPAQAAGIWDRVVDVCTDPGSLTVPSDSTPGVGGIRIGQMSPVDFILSNSELGEVVGVTETSYSADGTWVISQVYEQGTFTAYFVDETDFTWALTRVSDSATCQGNFVKQ